MKKLYQSLIATGVVALSLAMAQGNPQAPARPNTPAQAPQAQQNQKAAMPMVANFGQTIATFLGLTPPELASLSQGTQTLAEIARSLGKDVAQLEAALVKARNDALDQAVQNKAITAEQATQLKASSAAYVKLLLQQDFQLPRGGRGGPGMGQNRAPQGAPGMNQGRGQDQGRGQGQHQGRGPGKGPGGR